jgi:phosphoribosyl-ATP pyrophosphohydrolase
MNVFNEKAEIIEHCADNNEPEYNFNKVIEEIAEFQEAIVKQKTKHPDNPAKPAKKNMIKEFGDLIYRSVIYLKQEFPELELHELMMKIEFRIEEKLEGLEEVKKEKPASKSL